MKNVFRYMIALVVAGLLIAGAGPALAQDNWSVEASGTTYGLWGIDMRPGGPLTVVGMAGTILQSNGTGTWVSRPAGIGDHLFGISFANETNGVAVGSSGAIVTTEDGGITWNLVQNGMMEAYYQALMLDDTTGIAVGVNAINNAFVASTSDGWNEVGFDYYIPVFGQVGYEAMFYDVEQVNDSTLIAVANFPISGPPGGCVMRSEDGGATWESITLLEIHPMDMDFPTETTGYIVGQGGLYYKTFDGGLSWEQFSTGRADYLFGVDFTDADNGYVTGQWGTLLKTMDGGDSWYQFAWEGMDNLNRVKLADADSLWITGERGTILHTENGGGVHDDSNMAPLSFVIQEPELYDALPAAEVTFRWNSSVDPEGEPIVYRLRLNCQLFDTTITTTETSWTFDLGGRVRFLAPTEIYWQVAAEDSVLRTNASNGPSLFYIDPELTSVEEGAGTRQPVEFALHNAWPNPFNPTTQIEFDLASPQAIHLAVYNTLGREVAVLAEGEYSAGRHTVTLHGAGLASGVYFVRLDSPAFHAVRKVVLAR